MTESQTNNIVIASLQATFARCLEIARKKNADYSNDDNPFSNLLAAPMVGVTVERGILVRLTDKLTRISNLLDRPPQVSDESLDDSIDDAINYFALLKAYRQSIATPSTQPGPEPA